METWHEHPLHSMSTEERAWLLRCLTELRGVPGCIVEIGAGAGLTTAALAEAEPNRTIYAIDPLQGLNAPAHSPEEHLALFEHHTKHLPNIKLIREKSQDAAFAEPIALLIIDGDHSYEACRSDWDKYSPLVAHNGTVAFHDVSYAKWGLGPLRVVAELGLPLHKEGALAIVYPHGLERAKAKIPSPLPCLYINLDSRPDRAAALLTNLDGTLGDFVRAERLPARRAATADIPAGFVALDAGAKEAGWGCVLSHVAAIEEAKRRNWPAVLILEDDCAFIPTARVDLVAALRELPATADMLYLGGLPRGGLNQRYSIHLREATYFTCSHACIIFARAYDRVLAGLNAAKPGPFDFMCAALTDIRRFGTETPIAYQAGGKSDLTVGVSARMVDPAADVPASWHVHVLGHPDHPLFIPSAPTDAQLYLCDHFCRMLGGGNISFTYYGLAHSQVPGRGEFADIGTPTASHWVYGNNWHVEYTHRLRAALDRAVTAHQGQRQIVCSLYGYAHQGAWAYCYPPFVEAAVGYCDVWATYKVFPTYSHQTYVYATRRAATDEHKWFDTVIPHFLDPEEFTPAPQSRGYALYLGRPAADKGIHIAEHVCAATGVPLRTFTSGIYGRDKVRVIAEASVVFCPTLYNESFCLVAAEAQMCGVPVISTDWGSFAEVVEHGKTGFRCRSNAEFKNALAGCLDLDRDYIRERAIRLFSYAAALPQYLRYFDYVLRINAKDYYADGAARW